ncbi:carbohydrate ABC transporter permease [Candidatus Aerophobetes bacterium]|uniref:Carbohydrate ABC transporter permease n=1 Tax=Aerophobetes bacterium TaxID=2030807 RepID=A0A662DL06_UNCAE|nr:MAG: carbohydrate ABC transporter permease [Candidatus Aerophobetes bacterium]
MRSTKRTKIFSKTVIYLLVILLMLFVLFPFFWMASVALKSPNEQFKVPPTLFPTSPTLVNFFSALRYPFFLNYLFNSIIVASLTTLVVISVTILSAYSFSRIKFYFRKFFLVLIIISQLFPLAAIIVPIYIIISKIGLIDTYFSLIIAYLSFTVPISVWLLRGFIAGIPQELEEAAMVDGCSRLQAFLRIILPLSKPGIAATAAYVFYVTWQEFMFALTFITTESKRTLPVGILDFIGQYETNWGNLMAASIFVCLPVFILFMILQKQLVAGLTKGSLKA